MFNRILMPLDGSTESEAALSYVRMLAQKLKQVKLELVRCFEPPAAAFGLPELSYLYLGEEALTDDRVEKMVLDYLESKRREVAGLECEVVATGSDAATGILARSETADLILMSRHGRGGLGRWLMGGVAGKVVRSSHRPVLVLPATSLLEPKLDRIMVCLDGSDTADKAFTLALELARVAGARLLLYCFVRIIYTAPELVEMELADARAQVAAKQLAHPDLVAEVLVRTAHHNDIPDCAQEWEADLIVVGSHGRRGVGRWLLGSVAEDTIHYARTPVLVVH